MKTNQETFVGVDRPMYILEEERLRKNLSLIQHVAREAGVEIMSPHIYARRDGIDVQIPPTELNASAQSS